MDTAYFSAPDVKELMRKNEDLAPAFVDGILDAMPETATLIDGCEHSYWSLSDRSDFHIMYTKLRSVCSQLGNLRGQPFGNGNSGGALY